MTNASSRPVLNCGEERENPKSNSLESQLTQVAALYMLWAGFVFVSHAPDAWWSDAVPVPAADWDACLKTQDTQYRPVFQRAKKFRDEFAQSGIVLFKDVGIEGDG
jgi:hypothetical protein